MKEYLHNHNGQSIIKKADLHVHTTASDGHYNPAALIKKTKKAGLDAIAITDHDSVSGVSEAIKAGKKQGIEVIPGVEFSCALLGFRGKYQDLELHLVGLFVDYKNKQLIKTLKHIRTKGREKRVRIILKNLKEKFKIKISYNEILEINKKMKMQIGMIQVVEALIKQGLVKDWGDAKKYRNTINTSVQYKVEDAINMIKKVGGISILGHPLNTLCKIKPKPKNSEYEKILKYLRKKGLDGIEINYAKSTISEKKFLNTMIKKYNFLESGGTDFHYDNQKDVPNLGKLYAPYSYVKKMKEYLHKED